MWIETSILLMGFMFVNLIKGDLMLAHLAVTVCNTFIHGFNICNFTALSFPLLSVPFY